MSNTAPSRADTVVVFPLGRWCTPQETSQPHPPPSWWRVDSIHKRPVMQKTFPRHDIIMNSCETQPIFASNFQDHVSIINTLFPRYGDSHAKDKTVGETVLSLTWESHTGNTTSLFWDGPMPIFSNMIDHHSVCRNVISLKIAWEDIPEMGPSIS